MKVLFSSLLAIIALTFCFIASAQDIIYTISGEIDSQKTKLDSISVENQTKQSSFGFGALPERDDYRINLTQKKYWGSTSVYDLAYDNSLYLLENRPGVVSVGYSGQTATNASVTLYNINGQKLLAKNNLTLDNGSLVEVEINHTGVYLLWINTPRETKTFKAIGASKSGQLAIALQNNSATPLKSGQLYHVDDHTHAGDNIKIRVFKNNYVAAPIEITVEKDTSLVFPLDSVTAPTVQTLDASNIISTSATLNGSILNDGNNPIIECGFYWSATNENPGEADSIIVVEDSTGSFSAELSGLELNTTYYVRAFAINNKGTAYGEQKSLTTPDHISLCDALDNCDLTFTHSGNAEWFGQPEHNFFRGTAARSGKITVNQQSTIETYIEGPIVLSFWWKVSSENDYDELSLYIDNILSENISGNVDWHLIELKIPKGKHAVKWTYSKDPLFNDKLDCGFLDNIVLTSIEPALPIIKTKNPADINYTTAIAGGEIYSTGNDSIYANGLCWNTTGNPTINDNYTINSTGTTNWTLELKDLKPNTKYHVRAYATNSQGTTYGSQISFTTLPLITTCEALDNCSLNFSLEGNSEWFSQANHSYYNETSLQSGKIGKYQQSIIETEVTGPGYLAFWWKVSSEKYFDELEFHINNTKKTNISGDVDWQFMEFDIPEGKHILKWKYFKDGGRSEGHDCGWLDKIVFNTEKSTLPTVTTANIINIRFDIAEAGGEITSNGLSCVTNRGVCWNTTGNPTIADNKTTNGKGNGSWTSELIELQPETTYYVRAYATNAEGTSYGEQKSFKTHRAITLCEALDNCDLAFSVKNNNDAWFAQTADSYFGGSSAKSIASSTLEAVVNGPGMLSFWWKKKSNYYRDRYSFRLNYNTLLQIKDSDNWLYREIEIPEGKNTLRWEFYKEANSNDHFGLLDKVEFIPGEPSLPTISNVTISNISCNSASFSSEVTSTGNTIVTERGFYYSQTKDSINQHRKKDYSDKGLGKYGRKIEHLTPEIKHYACAYVTNKVGTVYSDIVEFTTLPIDLPQVETLSINNVSQTTATVSGKIISNGGGKIIESGICFNTTHEPTMEDSVIHSNKESGIFSCILSGLNPETKFYARSFVTNNKGTTYGKVFTFTTLPEFSLCEALENCELIFSNDQDAQWFPKPDNLVKGNWVAQSGAIEDLQSSDMETVVVGPGKISFYWKVSSESSKDFLYFYIGDKIKASISGHTEWQLIEFDLSEGIKTLKWNYKKSKNNRKGEDCGWLDKITYTAKELSLPDVTMKEIENITQNSAMVSGEITSTGNGIITAKGFCWSTTEEPTIANDTINIETTSLKYSSNLKDLEPNTTYFVRAYATNSQGTAYGDQMIITTAEVSIPQVSISKFFHITNNSGSCEANIVSEGFTNVTSRGICWNTTGEPTVNDNKIDNGKGIGKWTSEISKLAPGTNYYAKAYAIYENGTEYSYQKIFKTPKINQTGQFTDTRDGNKYNTVKIGSQIWMAENLKYLPQISPISLGASDEKHYYVYDYEGSEINQAKATEKYQTFGVYYNWMAVFDGKEGSITNPSNLQGVCPVGWHLPSNAEWEQLANYLADNGYNHDGSFGGGLGKIAKALSAQEYWYDCDKTGTVGNDLTKNNSSSFSALPCGDRSIYGNSSHSMNYAYFWSASEISSSAYNFIIAWDDRHAIIGYQWVFKDRGLNVRCVKDYEAPISLPTVSRTNVTETSQTKALFSSHVATSGLENIIEKGFIWNTTGTPDLNDNVKKLGEGEGMIRFKPENLIANTTYYVCSYAINDLGTKLGEVKSFKTPDNTPICEALDNCNLTFSNGGNTPWFAQSDVSHFGGSSAQSGFIGSNQKSTLETVVNGPGVLKFNWKISAYYFHKLTFNINDKFEEAIKHEQDWQLKTFNIPEGEYKLSWTFNKSTSEPNNSDYAWLDNIVFTPTEVVLPTISINNINNIKPNHATVYGNVKSNGFSSITARGYCWNTTGSPGINDSILIIKGNTSNFSGIINNLLQNTTYYIRAFATNSAGTGYSEQETFNTPSFSIPTISTTKLSDILQYSVKTGGSVIRDGYDQPTSCGVCWNTTGEPTNQDNKTSDTYENDMWESKIVELLPNTTYYVRAYATNNLGTGYGETLSFTTAEISKPTVTTSKVTYITQNSAEFEGIINEDGGIAITEQGFCWNTNGNPTLNGSKTTDDSEPVKWTYSISELSPNTTYYVRAYAKNNNGTTYGEQISFKTHKEVTYGNFTDQRDNKSYKTIQLGEQIWMAENLAYLPQVHASSYSSETVKYYYVYGYEGNSISEAKSTANYQTYGALYNWPAAMDGAEYSESNPSGVQGVCPAGWHLPSEAEWIELFNYLAENGFSVDGSTIDSIKMVAKYMAAKTHWLPSTDEGVIGNNLHLNNTSGFSALPGGRYEVLSNVFLDVNESGLWWSTSKEFGWSEVKNIRLNYNSSTYNISPFAWDFKNNGYSVRCVKD